MRRHFRRTPTVTRLEGRLLPTAAYPDTPRTAIHDSYVAQAEQSPTNVVFLGDSITYLWGTAQRPSLDKASWQADFGPLGASNFGIIGDQTQNLLYRVQDGELAGKPKVAVVMIGINDLLGGRSPQATAQGVASVVSAVRSESPNTDVLLLGILPTASSALNGEIAQVNQDLSGLGGTPGVEFLDPGREFLGAGGVDRANRLSSGVHPDAEGHQIISQAIDGPIRSLLAPPVAAKPPGATAPTIAMPAIPAPTGPDLLIPIVTATADPSTVSPSPIRHGAANDPSVSPAL